MRTAGPPPDRPHRLLPDPRHLRHHLQQYIDSGCIEYFAEQKRLGKIRYLGFSSHAKPEHLATFADYRDWDFAQIQLNYFDWFYGTAKAEYEELQKRNIPIMVMEPVRAGGSPP